MLTIYKFLTMRNFLKPCLFVYQLRLSNHITRQSFRPWDAARTPAKGSWKQQWRWWSWWGICGQRPWLRTANQRRLLRRRRLSWAGPWWPSIRARLQPAPPLRAGSWRRLRKVPAGGAQATRMDGNPHFLRSAHLAGFGRRAAPSTPSPAPWCS